MKPSPRLLAFLRGWEGLRTTAYDDGGGVWTIGYGHTVGVRQGDTCTPAQAEAWLAQEVTEFAAGVSAAVTAPIEQNQFDALVSLAYNIGIGAFRRSTLLRKINAGEPAADEFGRWIHDNGKVINGLVRRRAAERSMFVDADYTQYPGGPRIRPKDDVPAPPKAQPEETKVPILMTLLPSILNLFSGRAQAEISRATGADPAVAQQLMQAVVDKIAGAPVKTEAEAIAAVGTVLAAPAEVRAAKIAELEEYSLDYVDKLAPLIDRLATLDAARWAAEAEGKRTVSAIAIAERQAGLWDMTKTVVWFAAMTLTILVFSLLGALIYQATTGQRTIDSGLLGLAGPIFMASVAAWGAVIAFRFDGNKQSEAQNATIAQMSARLPTRGLST